MTRPVRLPVIPLAEPVQLVLGLDGVALALVGKRVPKPRRRPGPIAFAAKSRRRAA